MSNSQERPWSNNPNAPKIPRGLYAEEKHDFAGNLVGPVLYGILIVLSFQCMAALFDPVHRRGEGIRWGLVSYTAVMFSAVTLQTAMNLHIVSICYIDNREFPGNDAMFSGPFAYFVLIYAEAINVVPNALFLLSNWLADGFLLYRYYIIYSKNLLAVTFPCLMYLGSLGMGIMFIYLSTELVDAPPWVALPYFTISLSLNIILTLMIVIRLILRARETRAALGITGIGGLSKAIVTMLVESSTLFAVSSLLVLGPWSARSGVVNIFFPVLSENQAIASLLIIKRVANRSALTNDTIPSARMPSLRATSGGELMGDNGALPGGAPINSVGGRETGPGDLGVGAGTTIDSHQREV